MKIAICDDEIGTCSDIENMMTTAFYRMSNFL